MSARDVRSDDSAGVPGRLLNGSGDAQQASAADRDLAEPKATTPSGPQTSGLREPGAGGGPAVAGISGPPPTAPTESGRAAGSPVTLYDVARLAGVSTATVSRVVHGQDRVRASTRARVLGVINELGYVPDGAAQSLSRRRKNVIGLVGVERLCGLTMQYDIESMSLLFYDEIMRGVEQRIRHYNWSLLFTYLGEKGGDPGEKGGDELRRLRSMSGKVDGLLIGEGIVPSDELARLAERLPVVVIAGDPAERRVDVVTADNRGGSAALVSHLVQVHGRRRIFHVDGPPTAPDAKERRLALSEVVAAHDGVRLMGSHIGRFGVQSGLEAGQALLADRDNLPDAVVCANDQMAIGIMQAFARGGVRVPDEVAVVGFDDIFPCSLLEPSLTTVHQPMRMLGERACARLLERIAHPDLPTQVELLPTELVVRKSCGCVPDGAAAGPPAAGPAAAAGAAGMPGMSQLAAPAAVTIAAASDVAADPAGPRPGTPAPTPGDRAISTGPRRSRATSKS